MTLPGKRYWIPLLLVSIALLSGWSFFGYLWERHNPFYGKWEGDITYFNASGYDKTLQYALDRWEDTGVPLRFREVDDKSSADLVIYSSAEQLRKRCRTCLGYATIGDNLFAQGRIDLLPPVNHFEDHVIDFARVGVLIHEMGHVLGLRHTDDVCSLMNSDSFCYGLDNIYLSSNSQSAFCGPWQTDIDRLEDLYRFRARGIDPFCRERGRESLFYLERSRDMIGYLAKGDDYIKRVLDR